MGATTRNGRTRSRRAQAPSTFTSGQPPVLYAYGASKHGADLWFNLYDSSFSPPALMLIQPTGKLRFVQSTDGVTFTFGKATVVWDEGNIKFTPPIVPAIGDILIILPWNEAVRGPSNEWIAGSILDIV